MAQSEERLDLGDEAQAKSSRKREKLRSLQDREDTRLVMSTPGGRRFLARLLERSGVNRSSFTGNANTYFNEGQRNLGLFLQAELVDTSPDLYLTMLSESMKGSTE